MNDHAGSITATRAALALGLLGTNGLPALLAAIDDPEHQNRFMALWTIDALPDDLTPSAERVVPHLIACVSDQNDRRVAPTAVYALRKFRSAPQLVLPVLTNCLSSTDGRIRWSSATALGDLGRRAAPALPALTNALSDPDPRVGEAARYAIRIIASEAPGHATAP
jgi:HEAT repeat protein